MSGTKSGGKAAAITNKDIYGADFYEVIGAKGGQAKVPKGFGTDEEGRERARHFGRIGGSRSRRDMSAYRTQTPSKAPYDPKLEMCTFCKRRGHRALVCDTRLEVIEKNKRINAKYGIKRPC